MHAAKLLGHTAAAGLLVMAGWEWVDVEGCQVICVVAALELQAGWTDSWEMGLPPAVHHVRGPGCRAAAGP